MSAVSGKTGTVTVDGDTQCVTSWEVNIERDLIEVTDTCSDGWKEFILGLQGASGTLTSFEKISGESGTVALSNSNVAAATISGSVIFGNETWTSEVADAVTFTKEFTFTGEPTIS